LCVQNAWQTTECCQHEMVRYIELAIPPGMESVYNPIEDAALMARVGAVWIYCLLNNNKEVGSAYELKNPATGTTFELWWWCESAYYHNFRIERKEEVNKQK